MCSLFVFLDDGTIINQDFFKQINILEGELFSLNGSRFIHYFICIPLSDNRNKKYMNENCFIENLAASK